MMAIALMQAWGNDPRRWATGPERELLDRITGFAPAMAATAAQPGTFPARASIACTNCSDFHRASTPAWRRRSGRSSSSPSRSKVPAIARWASTAARNGGFRSARRRPAASTTKVPTGLINDALPTGLPGEEATGLFGDSPMAAALPARPAGDTKLTIVVTGVPLIGPEGMELALVPFQRFARLLGDVDAESWAYEPSTYEAMLAALARYESVVLLSGDVHIGWSAALDYWSSPDGGPVRTARLCSSSRAGSRKTGASRTAAARARALARRLRSRPRTRSCCTPSASAGALRFRTVTDAANATRPAGDTARTGASLLSRAAEDARAGRAHARLAEGHGRGTRAQLGVARGHGARPSRPDSTLPPKFDRRWTPVDLPVNPLDPSEGAWHAKAARRMAFGRVFATAPNVGIVTFARVGDNWSVRHVIAGELSRLADTGISPTGLQPYIVHDSRWRRWRRLRGTPPSEDHRRRRMGRGYDGTGRQAAARDRCRRSGSSPRTLAARCSTTFRRFSTTSRAKRS